jgi:hypothetical protein
MSYTEVFGGELLTPASVSYRSIVTSSNVTLVWPTEGQTGTNYAASFIDVEATLGGVEITLPPGTLVGTGKQIIINNVGVNNFAVKDADGNVLLSPAVSTCWVAVLRDNSTNAGQWRTFQFGAGTSAATAAALAGAGLKAISSTLNQNMTVFSFSTTYGASTNDRAKVLMWTAAGTGTLTLDAPGTVGTDWFVHVRNSGGGTLTVDPDGAVLIDGAATLALAPGNSCIIFCDGSAYYTVGLGIAATTSATYQTVAIGGTGNYTLLAAEQNKVLYQFTGVLTGNRTVIVPATIQQYWVDNATTGAFTLTIKTAAGAGVVVSTAARAILYCNGTDVIDADTGGLASPVGIADGGTSATTASGARTALGATSVGNSVFTAVDAAAARTAIGALATGATATGAGILSMATARMLGRSTAGTGDVEAITVGSGLLLSAGTLSSTAGGGSVTSVGMSVPAFLSVAGSPITGAGTLAVTLSGTALPVANGGTGATASTGSGNVVLATGPTLTNATLSGSTTITVADTSFTIQDNADPTKQAKFEASGISAGTIRTYTLPNASGQLVIGGTTITGSGGLTGGGDISTSQVISVATNGITNAMLATVSTATFKGRTTAGTGNVEDLTATQATALLNTFTTSLKGLVPSSGGGTTNFLRADGSFAATPDQTITLTGNVTGSGTGSFAATIANDAVTYAKMQNVATNQRVLGRTSGAGGDVEELSASTVLDWVDSTRGTIPYRGSGGWAGLDPNTAGFVLRDARSGADPSWVAGGWTLINSGTASGATTTDITLPTGYRLFKLVLGPGFYPGTDGSVIAIRFSYDGGSTYQTTNYTWIQAYGSSTPGATINQFTNNDASAWQSTALPLSSYGADNGTTYASWYEADIYPVAALPCQIKYTSSHLNTAGAAVTSTTGVGTSWNTNDRPDAVRLLMNSGNHTGPWALYGISG